VSQWYPSTIIAQILDHIINITLIWNRFARFVLGSTGYLLHPQLTGYWAASFSSNLCSTNPRAHPLSRYSIIGTTSETSGLCPGYSKPCSAGKPMEPPRSTLIMQLRILTQASLKAQIVSNSGSHSLRSLVTLTTSETKVTLSTIPKDYL